MIEYKILILKNNKTSWHNIEAINKSNALIQIKNKFGKGTKVIQIDEIEDNKLSYNEKRILGNRR